MNNALNIEMAIAAILLFIIIFIALRKNSISIKYSIMWLLLPIVFLLLVIFADPLETLAHSLGFETLSNFIFLAVIALLILICFTLTIIVSKQQTKLNKLNQDLSILKHKKSKNREK